MAKKGKTTTKARKSTAKSAARKAPARKATRRTAGAPRPSVAFRTVTPYLAVSDAAQAIDWYKKAFGARELSRMPAPGGKLMHAEVMIGDSRVMLSDVFPGSDVQDPSAVGGTTSNMHIYSKDVNKLWQQAVAAGARVTMPLEDQFWGDRYGKLTDPFGHSWALSFRARMTKEEKERKQQQAMEMFAAGTHHP
ncbi:MAG: VOC family protein [Armatimonadota bacterium]